MSPEDQERVGGYLSSCGLFSESAGELEVSVSALEELAWECGSVPDLLDILQALDRQRVRFHSFEAVLPRVREELTSRRAFAPLGAEPVVRQSSAARGENASAAVAEAAAADATGSSGAAATVAAVPTASDGATAPASAPSSESPPAAELSEPERNELVAWLQSESCTFFLDSHSDLNVTLAELDRLVAAGGGLRSTLGHLDEMSRAGARFEAFTDVLPALLRQIQTAADSGGAAAGSAALVAASSSSSSEHPAAAAAAAAAGSESASAQPSTAPIIPLSDSERDEVITLLSDCGLFSEATESLEIDPLDLDVMRTEAGSVEALLQALRDLDQRGARPRSFRELFEACREYWAQRASAAAAPAVAGPVDATAAAASAAASSASTVPALVPAASAEDAQALVAYISSPGCLLFSEASSDLTVEPEAIDALLHAAGDGGIVALLDVLRGLDAAGRRFELFEQLQAAVVDARTTGSFTSGATAPAAAAPQ
jgi:hypothetical protein